jgi:hypothetical protein
VGAGGKVVAVYIEEAHAVDEWPISSSRFNGDRGVVSVEQPTTDQQRLELAGKFVRDFGMKTPMLVDSVQNRLQNELGAWPLGVYVFSDGMLAYAGAPQNCTVAIAPAREVALRLLGATS